MNDVNFGGTKTSLFLSYSSPEIFDPIGLARYKFPESESCHLVNKKSSCVGFLVIGCLIQGVFFLLVRPKND